MPPMAHPCQLGLSNTEPTSQSPWAPTVLLLTVTEHFHLFALESDQLEETPSSFRDHMQKQAERTLSEASEIARSLGVEATTLHMEDDAPYQAIIRTAENQRCDVIVMASHGRGGVSALLLGSETMKVLAHSNISGPRRAVGGPACLSPGWSSGRRAGR